MAHDIDKEGYYYSVGSYITGGAYGEYAESNARKLAGELTINYGWTIDAVSAWFGAITHESQFNPAQIEGNYTVPQTNTGVGYIQWTPSAQLISFCNDWGVDWKLTSSQLRKWELERTTTDTDVKQWFLIGRYYNLYKSIFPNEKEPPATFEEFTHATLTEYSMVELSAQIIEFYTRPASWQDTSKWYRNAEDSTYWYELLTGQKPPIPPGPEPGSPEGILTFQPGLYTKPNRWVSHLMNGRGF